ncbi:MAG: SAM-dependent chlorinase/fluorinase [Alphaproteobacteria bacterium]
MKAKPYEKSSAKRPFVSISSDFGIQSEGVGIMKGVVLGICPEANVVDLTHGIQSFSIVDGAREMETVASLPVGIHVCVVDPGVGTDRHALILQVCRGDYLIGPDNGVLLPAAHALGGVESAKTIRNTTYIETTKSRTFGGRDIFSRAAAWLAAGVPVSELGSRIEVGDIWPAPYAEATLVNDQIFAQVIHVNKYGSAILNIKEAWLDEMGVAEGRQMTFQAANHGAVTVPRLRSFASAQIGEVVMVPDDYGRVELAINQGSLLEKFGTSLGSVLALKVIEKDSRRE